MSAHSGKWKKHHLFVKRKMWYQEAPHYASSSVCSPRWSAKTPHTSLTQERLYQCCMSGWATTLSNSHLIVIWDTDACWRKNLTLVAAHRSNHLRKPILVRNEGGVKSPNVSCCFPEMMFLEKTKFLEVCQPHILFYLHSLYVNLLIPCALEPAVIDYYVQIWANCVSTV